MLLGLQELIPMYLRQAGPDPAAMAARYDAETTVPNWREQLVCSRCSSRNVDMVVTGTERRWYWQRREALHREIYL